MIKPDITFALIQTFYRNGKTHYSAFLPLVVDCCLTSFPDDNIIVPDLQKNYRNKYGLVIPINVLKRILVIGVKQDFFINAGEVFVKTKKLKESNIKVIQDEYITKHETLLNEFRSFYRVTKNKDIKIDEAEKAMFAFMEENVYKVIKSSALRITDEDFNIDGAEEKISFGRFIKKAIEENNETTIKYLCEITKGVMIHNAVYLPNEGELERKFRDTYLIFDTPLILSLLGYAGEERQRAVKELVDLAKATDAKLGVFDFTVSEVVSVLQNCAEAIRDRIFSYHGRSVEYFIEQNYTYEEIIVFINRVEKDLRKCSISILQKNIDENTQMMDERRLEDCIDNIHHYQNRKAKLNDIDALAGVYSLRKGRNPYYLENSIAIFVTSNFLLVEAVHEYFKNEKQNIDIAMTDFYMTNVLWLKKPTKYPDLPKKRAIADIYAALLPNDDLWNQFIHTLEDMQGRNEITYDDVISLQTARETPELIMDAAAKGAGLLSPSSIQEIQEELERIRQEKQEKKQQDILKKKASFIADILSWCIYISLSIIIFFVLAGQTFDVSEFKFYPAILSFKWVGLVVLFVLSVANLFSGCTIWGLIKRTSKIFDKPIYYVLNGLIKLLTE